jgi:hypothetical protein
VTRALCLLAAAPAFAQSFHAAAKLGVPLTEYFETGHSGSLHGDADYSAATRRYTIGAAVEWRRREWALDFEAFYHRMGYVAIVNYFNSANGNFSNSAIDIKGNSWDFPLSIKRRFHRVFAAGGAVVRYIGSVRGKGQETMGSLVTGRSATTPLDTSDPSELRKRFYPGVTAVGGVILGRFAPELRYTRWTANIAQPGGLLRFPSNQVEVAVGFWF